MDAFLEKIIAFFFKIFHIEVKEKTMEIALQFVKFCLVGFTNTVVYYLINIATLFILRPLNWHWDYFAANTVAFILSVLWAFLLSNKFVFAQKEGEKRSALLTLLKTYLAYAFSDLVINNLLSYLWIDMLGISKFIAPLMNLVITVPLNFIINKFWAYRTKKVKEDEGELTKED